MQKSAVAVNDVSRGSGIRCGVEWVGVGIGARRKLAELETMVTIWAGWRTPGTVLGVRCFSQGGSWRGAAACSSCSLSEDVCRGLTAIGRPYKTYKTVSGSGSAFHGATRRYAMSERDDHPRRVRVLVLRESNKDKDEDSDHATPRHARPCHAMPRHDPCCVPRTVALSSKPLVQNGRCAVPYAMSTSFCGCMHACMPAVQVVFPLARHTHPCRSVRR